MEMDSTSRGRPFDRSSRDPPSMKKPRLLNKLEERTFIRSSNNISNGGDGRPVVQRQPALGFQLAAERDRESENSDSTRGYQPQSLSQSQLQQQQQELVNQYRTALAELTFNSKPIITNLTIIAGENVHAAKAIAATICNNILEVPSDQKLPSLYLLDSIAKNIGRDYNKYFATRLPEVFCKAYRQVDPTLHSGMRHLFGTWKGVFHPQSLQLIEKELGFQSAANGSSSSLEPESQPQRAARSIHVNPKYLEARQRLQQSSMEKAPTSDTNLINSLEDTDRQDRISANITSMRPTTNPLLKNIQQAQRNVGSVTRENERALYNNIESNEIVNERGFGSSLYGPGSNSTETILGQRNGFEKKHDFPNFSAKRSANADLITQPTNNVASKRFGDLNKSWKNSDEEEYMWDGRNSRMPNSVKSGSGSKRDPRLHPVPEKPGLEKNYLQKSQGTQNVESRIDREALFESLFGDHKDDDHIRQQMTPVVRSQLLSFKGISTSVNSISKSPLQPQIGPSGPVGLPPSAITGQQRHNSSRTLNNIAGQDGKPALVQGQKLVSQSHHDSFDTRVSQKPQMQQPLHTKKHELSQSSDLKISVDVNTSIGSSLDRIKSHDSILVSASNLQNEVDLPPVTSLLSTLVAKGLISASKDDSPSDQTPIRNVNPKIDTPVVSALVPKKTKIPLTDDNQSPSNSAVKDITMDIEDVKSVIGFEFKPDVIRRSHPAVISQLIIDELAHQCNICGLRFKLVELFNRHIEWHTLNKPEINVLNKPSRKWFIKFDDCVNNKKSEARSSGDQTIGQVQIDGEQMVVADESQCVCILCGELFDDFYSQAMEKWMFRKAVYFNIKDGSVGDTYGPIVHAHCISENSLSDLGLPGDVKRESE